MEMLLEMILRLLDLDLGWFGGLAMNSLMIGFMLLAVFYIFLEGKNFLKGSIVIFITLFAFLDLEHALGIAFFTGQAVLLYYLSKFVVLAIAENNAALKKNLIFINELQFYGSFVITWVLFG